jgi:hypothetical protein
VAEAAPEPLAARTVVFGGAEDVPVAVKLPSGWEAPDVFILESGSDPSFGLSFFDLANIYTDGCQEVLVQCPVGPTANDLVAAFGEPAGLPLRAACGDALTGMVVLLQPAPDRVAGVSQPRTR